MLSWIAVETAPRGEERALKGLRAHGYTAYLPVETVWKRSRARARERTERPLFTGYLFLGLTPGQSLYRARTIDGVRGFVSADGRPYEIPAAFINDLQARQAAGEFDHTPARRSIFKRGDPARLLTGPFKGQIGEMLQADDRGRVQLLLKGLFAGKLWVDDDRLEGV